MHCIVHCIVHYIAHCIVLYIVPYIAARVKVPCNLPRYLRLTTYQGTYGVLLTYQGSLPTAYYLPTAGGDDEE